MDNLSCSGNELTNLDVSHCDFLTVLDISMNQLKEIDLSACFILKGLECWNNNIKELDITWCPNLEDAYLKGTKDEFMRNMYRYSYNGSWLTINDGRKVKTSDNIELGATVRKSKKKATKITAKNKSFKAKTKTKKYTVTLKNGKKAVKGVKLTLKVKGRTYKAKTNKKGKATFKIRNLRKKGKYTASIRFAGNKTYKKSTKKIRITVKK